MTENDVPFIVQQWIAVGGLVALVALWIIIARGDRPR